MAEGQVKQLITLVGVDQASATVNKVSESLTGLNHAQAESVKKASESAGDLEKGLLGIKDVLGDLPAPVQQLADTFGGAEKILQIMPGPVGLIGAGLTVAGTAAYLLLKNISETAAKMKYLGDETTKGFRDNLGLSVDEAVKLSAAFRALPSGLKPSEETLRIIGERAQSMGLKAADAQIEYVKAIKGGIPALQEYENTYGKLGASALNLAAINRQLVSVGIDTAAIDALDQQKSAADELKQAKADAQALQQRINDETKTYVDLFDQWSKNSKSVVGATVDAQAQVLSGLGKELQAVALVVKQKEDVVRQEQAKKAAQEAATEANAAGAARVALAESRVGLAVTDSARRKAQIEAIDTKIVELKRQELAIQSQLSAKIITQQQAETARANLAAQRNAAEGQRVALEAAARAKAQAAYEKSKQQQTAELQAVAKLASTKAEAAAAAMADEDEVFRGRIIAIAEQERADIRAAKNEQSTAATKSAKIQAIELEAEMKRDKLREEAWAKVAERDKASEESAKKVADAQIAAADQLRKAQIAAASDPAAKFDLTLKDLQIEAERKLTEARQTGLYTAEELKTKQLAIETELANGIKEANAAKQASIDETMKKQREEIQKQVDLAADTVGSAASVVAAYQGKAGLGSALSETAKQVKEVSKAWEESKNKSGLVIGAVGAVAASFVDGEKEKAGILAIMELAQAAVSIATGDIAGAAAHGTAAALYGSVATGIISSGASSTGTSGAGGFNAGATAGGGTGAQGITGTTTVINFNAPLGTQYEIGKSVVKAQKAAFSMGWSPAMAAGV